jgi:microsomal prostaglandin-E synthase 1
MIRVIFSAKTGSLQSGSGMSVVRPGRARRLDEEPIMSSLLTDSQFKIYVFCSAVLSLEMLVLGAMTAARRAKVGAFSNPEDSKVSMEGAKFNEGIEHPEVARIMRAHRNLLEGVPLFFALGLIAVLANAHPMGVKIALITFTVARVLHAIVYLNGLQPWRTLFFFFGLLSLLGLMIMSVMAVLSAA